MIIKKPITSTTTKITNGSAILLAILAIIMSGGFMGQEDIYVCLDNSMAMQCDKLSKVNSDGIQTRCYFFSEELNKTKYKNCKTGWLPYTPEKEAEQLNFTQEHVYLFCEKSNELVSMCQVVDGNETIFQVGGKN